MNWLRSSLAQRLIAAAIAIELALLIGWWAMGGTLGWTKTSVEVRGIDPVTEIEFVRYEERFVPGIEILAAGSVVASSLVLAAFVIGRRAPQLQNNQDNLRR